MCQSWSNDEAVARQRFEGGRNDPERADDLWKALQMARSRAVQDYKGPGLLWVKVRYHGPHGWMPASCLVRDLSAVRFGSDPERPSMPPVIHATAPYDCLFDCLELSPADTPGKELPVIVNEKDNYEGGRPSPALRQLRETAEQVSSGEE